MSGFLADENFPGPAVAALRLAGFEIHLIAEEHPGASDDEVLAVSVSRKLTLLTFDKDFGELAYLRGRAASSGVILFRITPQSPEEVAQIATAALRSRLEWEGYFAVVARGRIRMRPLP